MNTAIADLERYERDAVAKLCPTIRWDVRRSREDRIDILSRLLRIEADGSYNNSVDEWGIAAPGVPLLWQLTLQPTLIVDVIPESEEDFFKRYAVTPRQLADLAHKGYVIPNLYHYDTDRQVGFRKHQQYGEVLNRILDRGYTRCRILSIRRRAFLDRFGADFAEAEEEGRAALAGCIESVPTKLLPSHTPTTREALSQIAVNWAYLRVLGSTNAEVQAWCERIKTNPPDSPGSTCAFFNELRGRKGLVASIYTACFGGCHLIPSATLRTMERAMASADTVHYCDAQSRRPLSMARRQLMEFLANVGLQRAILGTPVPDHEWAPPSAATAEEFKSFVAFLKDQRTLLMNAESFLNDAKKAARDTNVVLNSWRSYFELHETLRKAERTRKKCRRAVVAGGAGTGNVLGAVAGVILHEGVLRICLGGLGSATGSFVGNAVAEKWLDALSEGKRKVLTPLNELASWQARRGGKWKRPTSSGRL